MIPAGSKQFIISKEDEETQDRQKGHVFISSGGGSV